jgi:hypothetical protein
MVLRNGPRGGEDPIEAAPTGCYHAGMKLMLLSITLMLLFVGGVYHFGGFGIGDDVVGMILFTCLVVFLPAAFRAGDKPNGRS